MGVIKRLFCLAAVVLASPLYGQGLIYNLMGPADAVALKSTVRVDVVVLNPSNGAEDYELPVVLAGRLTNEERSWPVELQAQANPFGRVVPGGFAYEGFTFALPAGAKGRLVLALDRPSRLRVLIDATQGAATASADDSVSTPLGYKMNNLTAKRALKRAFEGRFEPHEPIYFIYGTGDLAAKFQFSFKYRVLGDNAGLTAALPGLNGLYFGYTQRSLWELQSDSSPFYDTSYMPELIYESQTILDPGSEGGLKWLGYQAALKHESNGRGGLDSRSMNTAYLRTAFVFGRLDGWNLLLVPRVYAYVGDLDNNPDIANYRGNADLMVVVGRNDGLALSLTGQLGRSSRHGSLQADLTFPVSFDRWFDFATYLLIQYWNGYGEDLLDYNQRSSSVRIGFSLVR